MADRTVAEQPPTRCEDANEHTWSFARDDESHCIAPGPAFYSCEVSVVHGYGTSQATQELIPACNASKPTLPCWRADDTDASCDGMTVAIDRDEPRATDDAVLGFCVTCR